MLDFIIIISLFATLITLVGTIIMLVRKTDTWKKWIYYFIIFTIIFTISIENIPDKNITNNTVNKITIPPHYTIATEKFAGKNGSSKNIKIFRITTDATTENDLRNIVEDMKLKTKELEVVWLFIHDTNEKPFGNHKATVKFANTSHGATMIGVKNKNEYIFEYKQPCDIEQVETQLTKNNNPILNMDSSEIERFKSYSSNLRGRTFIIRNEIIANTAIIEYGYKNLDLKTYNEYWGTGDAINKTLMEEPIRLLREFPALNTVTMTISYKSKIYNITADRKTIENYFNIDLNKIHDDKSLDLWRNEVVNKYFIKDVRKIYVDKFANIN